MNRLTLPLALALITHTALLARDIHIGKDADAPTIAHGIKLAQPGDTIHLEPKTYHDYAGFFAKKGEPGKPITLDGHGATLEGSDPIKVADWKEVAPGLFANDNLIARNDDAIMGRWFFLWNGKMNHMGRTSKGKLTPFKKPEELQADEWTFIKDASREKPPSKQVYGTFYLKLPAGKTLADANIRAPMRSAGVQMGGANAHLVVKNLTATHVYNDGFNIHGDCRACIFQNIRAIECGDDGISAHESAEYAVDGFVSIGNSTGITDTVDAHTTYNRVFIADCLGHDLFFLDRGRYKLSNSVVLSSSQNPFDVAGREDGRAELLIDNVLVRRLGAHSSPARVSRTAALIASRFTIENLPVEWRGEVKLDNCVINGTPVPEGRPAMGADRLALIKEIVPAEYQHLVSQP